MARQGRLRDCSGMQRRIYTDRGRAADWGNAAIVALVLGAVAAIAAIGIAMYDNSVLLATVEGTPASEVARAAGHGGGSLETTGSAR